MELLQRVGSKLPSMVPANQPPGTEVGCGWQALRPGAKLGWMLDQKPYIAPTYVPPNTETPYVA